VSQQRGNGRPRLRVTDRDHARLLLDRRMARLLGPFMEKACSVTDAAEQLGVTAAYLLPRVRRLERIGLLDVAEVKPRKGRSIKLYAAVGSEFFVPLSTLETADLAIHDRPLDDLLLDAFVDLVAQYVDFLPDPGFIVGRTDDRLRLHSGVDGDTSLNLRDATVPAVLNEWRWPRLSPQRAKALQIELLDALGRAVQDDDPTESRVVVSLRMAPVSRRVDDSVIR
jgi:hypothetical protein